MGKEIIREINQLGHITAEWDSDYKAIVLTIYSEFIDERPYYAIPYWGISDKAEKSLEKAFGLIAKLGSYIDSVEKINELENPTHQVVYYIYVRKE